MAYKIKDTKKITKKEKPKYTIVFDAGKPYKVTAENETQLKQELNKFYQANKDKDDDFDAKIYNEKGKDISESQFVEEIIGEIL